MKKTFLLVAVVAMALTSCSTVTKTATTLDVSNSMNSTSRADLVVAQQRISYSYRPTKSIRSGGVENCKNAAIAEALKRNGDADVLVAPEFTTRISHGLFGKKIKEITVTGYPATYKNFK